MANSERRYEVLVDADCEKVLKRLARADRKLYARIDAAILSLADDPRPPNARQLKTRRHVLYRVPVGDSWRILYAVVDDKLIVLLIDVTSRENAYQNIETLLNRMDEFLLEDD